MKKSCSLLLLLGLCFFAYPQDYQSLWLQYESNVENRLPESASDVLDEIEKKATAELNEPYLLKMIFERCSLLEMRSENPYDSILRYCESYLNKLSSPSQLLLALELCQYKDDVSEILSDFNLDSAKTISMMTYAPIFDSASDFDVEKEPTLFDYSLHKLINFYDYRNTNSSEIDDLYSELIDFDRENGFVKAYFYNNINLIKRSPLDSRFEKYQALLVECSDNEIIAEIKLLQIDCLTSPTIENKDYVTALRLCDEALSLVDKKNPVYQQCMLFRNAVTKKYVDVSIRNVNLPGEPIPIGLKYRNTTNPSYRVVRTNTSFLQNRNAHFPDKSFKSLLLNNVVCAKTLDVPQEYDYQYHSSLIALPPLDCGSYFLVLSNDDDFDDVEELLFVPFQVSALSFVSYGSDDENAFVVLDRASGSPKCGVKAEMFSVKYSYNSSNYVLTKLGVSESDAGGEIFTSDYKNVDCMRLSFSGDTLLADYYCRSYRYYDENERLRTTFFTDRPIYRPGQTVNFKGIVLKEKGEEKELCENLLTTVYLRDANYQIIDSLSLTTNEYGSLSGSFVLPTDRMSGDFTIQDSNGSKRFKVEKYKRPTFEVCFDEPQREYGLGDSITVSGKIMSFSGFGLDNVHYRYSVVRRQYSPFKCYYVMPFYSNEEVVYNGEGKTLNDGIFVIDFQLATLSDTEAVDASGYVFVVKVEATNAQGETQMGSLSFSASSRKYFFSLDGGYRPSNEGLVVEQKQLSDVNVRVLNAMGEPVNSRVMFKVIKKQEPTTTFVDLGDFDRQLIPDSLLSLYFPHHHFYPTDNDKYIVVNQSVIYVDSDTRLVDVLNPNLDPGRYEIVMSAIDDSLSLSTENILIFNKKSKKLPVHSLLWTYVDKTTAQPGDVLNISVGSSEKDVTAMLLIFSNGKKIKTECISLNNNILRCRYKVKEEDRGAITFEVAAVKDNVVKIFNETVEIPYNNLKLDVSVETGGDTLVPGQKVSWNIKVRDNKGKPVEAELLACMDDASLDKFASDNWSFNTLPFATRPAMMRADNGFSTITKCQTASNGYVFLSRNPLLSDVTLLNRLSFRGGALLNKLSVMETASAVGYASDESYDDAPEYFEKTSLNESINNEVRSDFNETAFFLPQLKTDKHGNVIVESSLPNSLTKWNLRLLANNKTLSVGQLEKELFTQKPLMVMADVPRFIYTGDTLVVVANILNNSGTKVSPEVMFELIDGLSDSARYFQRAAITINEIHNGQSAPAYFKVAIDNDADFLTFRFSASAGELFDSEQYTIPVLKNETLVTNTMSLTVNPYLSKTFEYSAEENEKPIGYRLNLCPNPVWYAIMAMPYIIEENELYIENVFHKYFTNVMASYLVSEIPQIKDCFQEWQCTDAGTLASQLEKDEELRQVLLKSTPWVLDALDERKQRENIKLLFDTSAVEKEIADALQVIAERQTINGGWPWIEGMPESEMMTQYIVEGFGKLNSLPIDNLSLPTDVIANALRFLDNKIVERYNKVIEENYSNNWICSKMLIDDLLALSYFIDFERSPQYEQASDYFLEKMSEDWKQHGFAEQASIALILSRNGRKSESLAILNSLREFAQTNELGMYWLSSQSFVNKGFRRSVSVSEEVHIMDAFREIDPRTEEIDAMRLWFLTQKQTNKWDNNRHTAEAIFSLISGRGEWLTDDSVSVAINGQPIDLEGAEAGTRFVMRTFGSGEISEKGTVTVENRTSHLVWGGFFTQYLVPIDDVRATNDAISMKRELFVERDVNGKRHYVPVSQSDIKVGDKVKTIIIVESNQDLEFVYLKDLRGACFEPIEQVSTYAFSDGLSYYKCIDDVATEFFFDKVPRGRYEFSHESFATKEGNFSGGYAVIQCQYSPEFGAYSNAGRVKVEGRK